MLRDNIAVHIVKRTECGLARRIELPESHIRMACKLHPPKRGGFINPGMANDIVVSHDELTSRTKEQRNIAIGSDLAWRQGKRGELLVYLTKAQDGVKGCS
jgi:hypothetical protein